jgi:hypothetical protein
MGWNIGWDGMVIDGMVLAGDRPSDRRTKVRNNVASKVRNNVAWLPCTDDDEDNNKKCGDIFNSVSV